LDYEVIEDRLWDKSVKPKAVFNNYMEAKARKKELGDKYIVREKLVAESMTKQVAEVYCFQFKEAGGWANYTICESTGEFSIQSDWGDYSYRWNRYGLGDKALKEFLASCDAHYIVDKFSYKKPREFKAEFSLEATAKDIKSQILKERRSRDISQNRAKALWEFVKDEIEGSSDCEDVHFFYDRLSQDVDPHGEFGEYHTYSLLEFLGDDYMCHGPVYIPSHRYVFCLQTLVPFFLDFLKEELHERTSSKKETK